MNSIAIQNCSVSFSDSFLLRDISFTLELDQHWVILGPNGSGKSAIAALLAGFGELKAGSIQGLPSRVSLVSFESQRQLIERELDRDESDITDEIFEGTQVQEILLEDCVDSQRLERLIDLFEFRTKLDRGFRNLSTGETRKVLLMKALCSNPSLLVLDEPFDGLDVASTKILKSILEEFKRKHPIVLVLNRFDEVPDWVTHFVYTKSVSEGIVTYGGIAHVIARDNKLAMESLNQLVQLTKTDVFFPEADSSDAVPELNPVDPLVRMKDVSIAYGDKVIFEHLNWQVDPGQHWQVVGPNGSGKTCLLNLITGDHPQCYANDIFVLGFQRGQGESIWEIKQHIGYVSSALQWDYRVSINLMNVILSGFFDSIGMYQKATDQQTKIATQWLKLLAMDARWDQPFSQLSYGDQRLILIARAMVKHPHMLILDEPCLGLDDLNRQLVLALIDRICRGSETTVLYVNHHQEDAIDGIEQILTLGRG
ncbi:MAG: molybdate ABC transporter ATP-binding protein ModF [Pseudomonadales bacterium]|nr:molybdate ABC transporter ATP-binding protein ModF [Pseudomonadales bacterium]